MKTNAQTQTRQNLLYEEVGFKIRSMIEKGTYRVGERIPSIRNLSRQMHVSINTVMEAYSNLENVGLIEARPQSGYYVSYRRLEPATKREKKKVIEDIAPNCVTFADVPLQVMRNLYNVSLVPLGGGSPNPDLLPIDKLNRMLATESRRFRIQSVSYTAAPGIKKLRTQIAKRSLNYGCNLAPEDIMITSGCIEAITLALQATCRPGDTVAIGSPVYYTFLHSIQWMGLKVLEIPSTPEDGLSLEVLRYAIKHNPVHACIIISNFNNPLGSLMTDEKKRELVALLAKHNIPLIEDDVYGDLAFGANRPSAAKAYDEKGLVLYCSSFSKTLAPGYRVGWIVPGKFRQRVEQLKSVFNVATASPTQLAIAEFITNGGYDQHLRKLRRTFARQIAYVRNAVGRYFPQGTRVTHPEGGFILWVEMPEGVDSLKLYEGALQNGISIAPGIIFSITGDKYNNCIRLNAAFWSERVEQALETLGGLAEAMM
ncbi:MAG: GntR family transcriptional regulator [Deltaproteobacteria bacterium RBG_16_44_11]|nr:MAG: GntR family transcriptional regulator [Deltaproteobacteria bacterium RBG_16_44_11]